MNSLLWLIVTVIDLYIWCVILFIIMSWLIHFSVINLRNRFIFVVNDVLWRLTEPALGRIRRYMPNLGGIDLSPIVLFLLLWFAQRLLIEYWPR